MLLLIIKKTGRQMRTGVDFINMIIKINLTHM